MLCIFVSFADAIAKNCSQYAHTYAHVCISCASTILDISLKLEKYFDFAREHARKIISFKSCSLLMQQKKRILPNRNWTLLISPTNSRVLSGEEIPVRHDTLAFSSSLESSHQNFAPGALREIFQFGDPSPFFGIYASFALVFLRIFLGYFLPFAMFAKRQECEVHSFSDRIVP